MRDNTRKIPIHKDPLDLGFNLYKKKEIEIKTGVSVLCGCNGAGKTTLLKQIKEYLDVENIPCIYYNNLFDGGNNSRQNSLDRGDMSFVIKSAIKSEGENIILNMGKLSKRIGEFIRTGIDVKDNPFHNLFCNKEKENNSLERWILLDAIDSGLSIDNVCKLKELFQLILKHDGDRYEIYILVVANQYEMCRGEKCLDVYNGKYITFKDYEDYRNFVLRSRKIKDGRK